MTGADRLLFKAEDFERFAGHEAKIRLAVPLNGRRNFKGIIKGLNGDYINIAVDNQEFELLFTHIERARLVPEY